MSGLVLKSGAELEEIVDAATGKIINPHVPLFIAKAPWYSTIDHVVGKRGDTPDTIDKWYDRGATGQKATKYRKGACENCGAMTHKAKDCMERPRKKGAKFTGRSIAADEVIQNVNLGFEAKRDRWNGYQAEEQLEKIKEWELVEERKKQIREEKVKQGLLLEDEFGGMPGQEETEATDGVEQKVDAKNRMTVRNLRIREDTAKYLRNLDLDSAYYDPKTRSMRDNPYPGKDPKELLYAGDNFERLSGQVKRVSQLKDFAWEKTSANEQDRLLSLQSNPTKAEMLYKSFQEGGSKPISQKQDSILSKYGGQEHLETLPQELIIGQSEEWVEYNATGELIRGNKPVVRSRWEEDVYLSNHTSIWGSFWEDGQWGFACCQSFVKGSYCGGIQSIEARIYQKKRMEAQLAAPRNSEKQPDEQQSKSLMEVHKEKLGGKGKAVLALERIKDAEALEKAKLEAEIQEIKEKEKKEKKLREQDALEKAQRGKARFQSEVKGLKYRDGVVLGTNGAAQGMDDEDEMVPYLPKDARVQVALESIELAKVAAQGDKGTSFLRRKRKWEMTDEEKEAYRIVQHHHDDPMAPFIKKL
ncbi:mRNA splicing protein [Kappamyces sp. JEL0680]|nr:mRNA splicing protein [Kappamyces sp. JEL0680]